MTKPHYFLDRWVTDREKQIIKFNSIINLENLNNHHHRSSVDTFDLILSFVAFHRNRYSAKPTIDNGIEQISYARPMLIEQGR